jgi:hypothetical protein
MLASPRWIVASLALLQGCFTDPPPSPGGDASTGAPATSSTTGTTDPATASSGSASTSGLDTSSSGAGSSGTGESSEGSSSSASTGIVQVCGDGIVGDDEMCDGGAGCRDCMFTDYACNPLNNAGCGAGTRCGLITFETETFGCIAPGPGDLAAECGFSSANDGDCATDLTCLFNPQTPLCDVGNCCVRYCSLAEVDPGCGDAEMCLVFFPDPIYEGLEHLGFCGG